MSIYQQAVADGTIAVLPGVAPERQAAASALTVEQMAWATYAAFVLGGAVAGYLIGGRETAVAGGVLGVAGVAIFGDIEWTG